MTSWWATRPGRRTEWIGHVAVHQLRRPRRGPAGRVDLAVVVQLDDLGLRHVPGRLGGELHHQHRADREVRRDEDVARRRSSPASCGEVPAGRPDDRVHARRRRRRGRFERRVGRGEVDDDVDVAEDRPRARCPAPGRPGRSSSMSSARLHGGADRLPIRPAAPATPTRIMRRAARRHARLDRLRAAAPTERLLVAADARRRSCARARRARAPARASRRA